MPSITVNSIASFIGFIALLAGFFLILTGLGVVKVEKITVTPGRLTLGTEIVLSIIGIVLLWSDIQSSFQGVPLTPTAASTTTLESFQPDQPSVCGTLKLEAIRPSAILENELREYKLIGVGFCNDTSISIATKAFVGNDPQNYPNGLPIEVSNDGTWMTVYINPTISSDKNSVEIIVNNPDGNSASLTVGYQR